MGEFSVKALNVRDGIIGALVAAGSLIAVPFGLSSVIRTKYAGSLTPDDLHALSALVLYAVVFGAAVTATMYLYGCYPKGTKSRMFFGMVSGILIVIYSFMVLVLSGLTPVLMDIGIRLDTKYAALMVAYASVPLVFSAGGDYISSRKKWLESARSIQTRTVSAR